jgi:hypothetical protein
MAWPKLAWHKWFVRGLVFSILASGVVGTLAYQHWTNPSAVGAQVLAKVQAMFPGAVVSLESASLHIFGYIRVHELRLARRDDPGVELAKIPSATLYHNKEKMLEGELSFRKIELHRPRLRVTRGPDGKWSVQGLCAPGKSGQPAPTIVVHDAEIQFEDKLPEGAPLKLELTGVNLTLINDPLETVLIEGVAQADLLGNVTLHGAWQRKSNDVSLTIKTHGTPLNDGLLARLGCVCPCRKLEGLQIQGQADAEMHLTYRSGRERPFAYELGCHVQKTTLKHPELPFPLNEIDAHLTFDGSELRLASLRARSGAAVIAAKAVGHMPCPEQDFSASVRAEHVELAEGLGERLPGKLRELMALYEPRGHATLEVDVARQGGQWAATANGTASRVTLLPEDVSACFQRFPYPLQRIQGALHYTLAQQHLAVDVVGYVHGRPVFIKGQSQGQSPHLELSYDIAATALPIDASLIAALPQPMRDVTAAFHLTGKVDVQANIRRHPTDDKFRGEYHICLHDASTVWDQFPYPLTNVAGRIDVFPTHWEFRNFHGEHGGGRVAIEVRSANVDGQHAKPGVIVDMIGKNLLFDEELRAALRTMPALAKAWETFRPSGRFNVTAAVERRGKEPDDLEVSVDVQGPTVQPGFFPYPLHDVAGHFHLKDQRLDVRRLSATHDLARWYLDKGAVELHPAGAFYAKLPDLQAEQLVLDPELIAALPAKFRDAAVGLRCPDPLRFKTDLIVSHGGPGALPDVWWRGQVWLDDAKMTAGLPLTHVKGTIASEGRHNGKQLVALDGNLALERAALFNQPFRNARARFLVQEDLPELLKIDLVAPIFGGDVAGNAAVDFQKGPRYELNVTASQIDLEEFGRHNLGSDSKLSGFAVGRLYLEGIGSDLDTLDGYGSLDVPNGKLLNLPFLLDLIKFLGLRWPDRTMFEELHAQYAIRRRRAIINNLELFGNAVSFTGKGEINLDGTDLQLELYPSWARIEQLLPPAVRSMPPTLSKNLLTVEARGKITGDSKDIKFTKRPVPLLVDPLLHLRDRLVNSPSPELRREDHGFLERLP